MNLRAAIAAILALAVLRAAPVEAQSWSGILKPVGPSEKGVMQSAVDWSSAGLPGGVPSASWSQCGPTLEASAFGDGTTDATAAINAAIAACGPNQYVLLGPGKFLFNSAGAGSPQIRLDKDSVVLRGSGASQTILSSTGDNQDGWITVGSGEDPGKGYGTGNPVTNSRNIVSGATAGSTSIVVDDAAAFEVGGNLLVQETNDPAYVTKFGGSEPSGGGCSYCDAFWNGDRSRGQIVEITAIAGTTISFAPPLYTAYTLSPQALYFMPVKHAGVENLQIVANNTHVSSRNAEIVLYSCAYCWIRGVAFNYNDGDYAKIYWGFRDEIRDNYLSNGYHHGPGSDNGTILVSFKSTACKIENNVMERAENPVMLNFGAAGNVISYNYSTGAFGIPGSIVASVEWHSAHVQFTLVEGNIAGALWLDVGHGSTSQTTSFRNWWLGTQLVCNPTDDTRATVDCSGSNAAWARDGARAVGVDSLATYNNIVGDVVSSPAQMNLTGTKVAVIKWPSPRKYNGESYGLSFGYTLFGDDGSNELDSTKAFSTTFLHGVHNHIDGSTTWANGVSQTLPASFYLSAKPAWWGTLSWPAIGPDVTGGTVSVGLQGASPGGHANLIPAMNCFYNVMGGVEGGAGGPRDFDADKCYRNAISTGDGGIDGRSSADAGADQGQRADGTGAGDGGGRRPGGDGCGCMAGARADSTSSGILLLLLAAGALWLARRRP